MLVLHANWSGAAMCLWAESADRCARALGSMAAADDGNGAVATLPATQTATAHPFAESAADLEDALRGADLLNGTITESTTLTLRLPGDGHGPWPSDRLDLALGVDERLTDPVLLPCTVPALRLPPAETLSLLLALEDAGPRRRIDFGHECRYWFAVARFVVELLADQRWIPTVIQARDRGMRAAWRPWLHDEAMRERVGFLVRAMPPAARAVVDEHAHAPWPLLDDALNVLTDAQVRSTLINDDFADAIDGRDPAADPHVAWLAGLLAADDRVTAPPGGEVEMLRDAGRWIGRLDDTGRDRSLHLVLTLHEPDPAGLGDDEMAPQNVSWPLTFALRSADHPEELLDAEQIWSQSSTSPSGAAAGDTPPEILLAELSRAARLYPPLEAALSDAAPTRLELATNDAYALLREYRPLLEESGITVFTPSWWDAPSSRLGLRMRVDSPEAEELGPAPGTSSTTSMLGLKSLVQYQWEVAVGDQPLSADAFQRLARQSVPLVRVQGRWVEIQPDDMLAAAKFLRERPGGEITLLEAIQLAHGVDVQPHGLPVSGLDATGWVSELLHGTVENHPIPMIDQPAAFKGDLRPYQLRGLSWLAFLDRYGLGACLADDMGLGKTIQLIALLQHERLDAAKVPPTLLIVPTSLIGNWSRELERFAPELTYAIHHGPDRPTGEAFAELARGRDVTITTYALVGRDQDALGRVTWRRVALDEAQYIKNPPTKQTMTIRALKAERRIALTGTPLENRLSELWSIMEFCNPGYLGHQSEFRRRFAVPIERRRDAVQAEHLRNLVQPFVLRRLKTDPNVITDLPECIVTKEFATLTPEQAALYQRTVDSMLRTVDGSEGMQRRGLVLATLTKLKQICNHPAQFLEEASSSASAAASPDGPPLFDRSGKARRLMQLLEEVLAAGEKSLIFTQFRQMGHLLTAMIQHELGVGTLFLHGGTPTKKRQGMIDRFQNDADGPPVFVLSLKAGGVGLNLTSANHVFHYDRWWNPAVEQQATDRAFRIGQTRNVHVHKFVCVGTLEERIDQMIEQKTELADNIIGSGESWLTEMSTSHLQELLTLRQSAMEADA